MLSRAVLTALWNNELQGFIITIRSSISTHDQRDHGWKCCWRTCGREEKEDVKTTLAPFPWALSSCRGFCDAASSTERAGGASYQHQTSHPPQTHSNTSCLQAQRTQHSMTSTEALLNLRLSSINNLGVKILQEVLESFKLCNHADYCLISEWRS